MTLPHQCRCVTCGEIGTIVPSLPNVFADMPRAYGGTERREKPIVPEETIYDTVAAPLSSYVSVPTCTHGYTRCMPCKFPAP
jgi:hypothetical protein